MIIIDNVVMNRKEIIFTNNKDEKILIFLTIQTHDLKDKKSLMNIWVKNGWLEKPIEKTLRLELFVYDKKDNCFNKYNPQIIPNTNTINFDWMLEATEKNINKLLNEAYRIANA